MAFYLPYVTTTFHYTAFSSSYTTITMPPQRPYFIYAAATCHHLISFTQPFLFHMSPPYFIYTAYWSYVTTIFQLHSLFFAIRHHHILSVQPIGCRMSPLCFIWIVFSLPYVTTIFHLHSLLVVICHHYISSDI